MKKLWWIILLFIFPISVYGAGTEKYYIDVTVNNDGSATFKEMIIFSGEYNYLERNLYVKGNYTKFIGDSADDFYETDIYNASSITNICASSVSKNVSGFNYINNHNDCFSLTNNGYKGLNKKYTLNSNDGDYTIRIYNHSDLNEAFYLEYTVMDAVVVHNDVAELLFNFSWSEDIEDYQVYLHLPNDSNEFRIFSHGPMHGENELVDKKTGYAYWNYLSGNTETDIRIVFDKNLVANASKKSNVLGLNKIIEFETKQAEIQNDLREQLKQEIISNAKNYVAYAEKYPNRDNYNTALYYVELLDEGELKSDLSKRLTVVYNEIVRREKIRRTIAYTICGCWLVGLAILLYKFYKKYDKEHESMFKHEYLRELPSTYGPEILGYLLTKNNIKSEYLSASIMELIRKKSLKIDTDYSNNKNFKIIDLKNTEIDNTLNESEKLLKKWFIDEVGNGEYVTNDDIKKASKKDYESFLSSYKVWKNSVIAKGNSMNFYEKNGGKKGIYSLYCLSGILIHLLCSYLDPYTWFWFIITVIGIIGLIYILVSDKRSSYGNDEYVKWMAFKRFLEDFGRFKEKELPEIYLWEHFLVYATCFGIADKVEKTMKMKIQEYNLDTTGTYIPTLYTRNIMLSNLINKSVASGISSAQSAYTAAHSSSSSFGGFGGGASFGGGGGGFGGGGGRG